jgi:hypothetical protein
MKDLNSIVLKLGIIGLMILLIRTGLLGLRYDILKRDNDLKYSGNHFGTAKGLRLPFKRNETNNNQIIQNAIDNYNKSTIIFWKYFLIVSVVLILLYCFNN